MLISVRICDAVCAKPEKAAKPGVFSVSERQLDARRVLSDEAVEVVKRMADTGPKDRICHRMEMVRRRLSSRSAGSPGEESFVPQRGLGESRLVTDGNLFLIYVLIAFDKT